MTLIEMTALSLALGADLFSVAVPLGMARPLRRQMLCLSAVFALFHMVMLALGAVGGAYLARTIDRIGAVSDIEWLITENWAVIFGGAVLVIFGLSMIRVGRNERGCDAIPQGIALVCLAISVSCDALAVGVGMGMVTSSWTELTMILGIVIFAVSTAGLIVGRQLGRMLARCAQPIGGAVLALWGLYMIERSL